MVSWPPFLFPKVKKPAAPQVLEVAHGGTVYRVAVRRNKAARRLILKVRSDSGEPVLTLPPRTTLATATDFLSRHTGWLAERVRRLPERIAFEPGAVIPLRGVEHRIVHVPALRGGVVVSPPAGAGETGTIAVHAPEGHLARRLLDFLKAEARRDLSAAVAVHARSLGVTVSRLTVKDTKSRWGSCAASGALAFSWRLILAPPFVLEYLAAHEVAHRREMNHSPRYWAEVARAFPAYEAAESWLTRHGARLHRYGPAGARPDAR